MVILQYTVARRTIQRLTKRFKNSLQTWKPISDRVVMAKFKSNVPTKESEDTE